MLDPHTVYGASAPSQSYDDPISEPAPELPQGVTSTNAQCAMRQLFRTAELDLGHFGTPEWNPLGDIIPVGSRIVIKPNWVSHHNQSGAGLDSLVTHGSVIRALLSYIKPLNPTSLILGDAPIQGCDFARLALESDFESIMETARQLDLDLSIRDFRRSVLPGGQLESKSVTTSRTDQDYVLFDMGENSLLEPITDDHDRFRVTMYDPEALNRTHSRGRHEYLVAREILEADVVISMPKLKTHKKAGVTGALKNMVGMNGLKDYLPHHRKGGSESGGDCYPGRSGIKSIIENLLDTANRADSTTRKTAVKAATRAAMKINKLVGNDANLEGSWHGNDTVWRMCLDLQTILHFGRHDGTLSDVPQRSVFTVTDAIVAGEGDGPLAPTPVPLGLLTLGSNVTAIEWVHAQLMGLDPMRIPLIREAFKPRAQSLVDFPPDGVRTRFDGADCGLNQLVDHYGRRFKPPAGWEGHCETAGHRS